MDNNASVEDMDVRRLCSTWLSPSKVPRSFAEQCSLLIARTMTATKDEVVLGQLFDSISEQTRRKYHGSLHTLDGAFGRMRRVVQMALADQPEAIQQQLWGVALKVLNLRSGERRSLRSEQQQRIETANTHVFTFNEQTLRTLLARLAHSVDEHDAVLLLMLESGLRMIEVLSVATVVSATVNSRAECDWVTVSNLAKSRAVDRKVTKPLLTLSWESFNGRLESLRALVLRKTNQEMEQKERKAITNLYNHHVNARVRLHLGPYTSHVARKIYGALSYRWYGMFRGTSLNAWLQSVMGHTHMATSLSYSNVVVVGDPDSKSADLVSDGDIEFFAKAGVFPIGLDEVLARVGDTAARVRWLKLLQKHFVNEKDYTMNDDGTIGVSVWSMLDLMDKSGRPRALDMTRRVREALLGQLCRKSKD